MEEFNRWEQMLSLLGAQPAKRPSTQARIDLSVPRGGARSGAWRQTSVIAVEKQGEHSVLVSWSDPTRCRYIDQRWVPSRSRRSGHCALTGREIRCGDAIYKPQWRGPHRPCNSAEMILAVELERVAVPMEPVPAGSIRIELTQRLLEPRAA